MSLCIADNLRMLRRKNGYTLEALAEIITVSRQAIAKWEAGDTYPDIVNCTKLANLYKVSLDELVNKPLQAAVMQEYCEANDKICGVVDISDTCDIHLHDSVMEMFDFHPGEKILLLADKKQGIALVKCTLS